ncbi:hypothetical protein BKA83DRAFT_4043072, partial [Pisolithus microcarpus]
MASDGPPAFNTRGAKGVGSRGRGSRGGSGRESLGNNPTLRIQWESGGVERTSKMVKWLVDHPADCVMLFSEDKNAPKSHGRPHSTKLDVYGAIADAVFKDDTKYATSYVSTPNKFRDSVTHRLEHLKSKYREYAARFVQTGNGIDHRVLETGPAYDNVLQRVLSEFPWFSDLHGLWRAIPSYSAKPVTSVP